MGFFLFASWWCRGQRDLITLCAIGSSPYETDEPIITAENGYEFVRRSPEFFNLEEVAG